MKSFIVYADGSRRIEEMPMPTYGEYDALVKMESCGICNGTDMKIIHGKFKGIENYPVVLGHEGVGRVVEIGAKVRNYKIGDLVLLPFWGDVPEGYWSAWGTYSEFNTVTDAQAQFDDGLIPGEFAWAQNVLPEGFDPISSAMIITFREVLSTGKIFGLEANKSICVLGDNTCRLSDPSSDFFSAYLDILLPGSLRFFLRHLTQFYEVIHQGVVSCNMEDPLL